MDNHLHLLIETPEANLNRSMQWLGGKEREQRQARKLARPVAWPEIISALEQARDEKWTQFSVRHGDWGRDAALWIGRRQGRLPLPRLEELAGGTDYAAVSAAVRRFGQRIASDTTLRRKLDKIERVIVNVEIRR